MNLLKDYTTEQKIKKKFWGKRVRKIFKSSPKDPEPTITVHTVSNHLGFLKGEQQKLRKGGSRCYEQALRSFYMGIERINTRVD